MKRQSHSLRLNDSSSIFGSLSEGADLMDGILAECEKHHIRSGLVTCIGSLKEVGYVLFKAVDGLPSGYGNEIEINQPVELVNATGFICEDENHELDLHLHGLVTEENGKVSAGHFVRGKNPTLITVEFTIIQSEELKASRTFDKDLGFKVINFSS
ncbi:DNA-binding protein [Halobacillus shinanisalinarum]|uniref:DNA-binding protein n=1 Tax=Halobacillus shinanisalinarum TaxID=2932258 RepID=A0ABY4GVJ3_9BACI|nr:PPC domain-containing DNA-binding protein [Halobacillus shinanisalinarum]UOQ91923.1 DNA-binding protein [Halobacillus shinanisalinarum]